MRFHDLSISTGELSKISGLSFNQFEGVYVFWKTLNVSTVVFNVDGQYDCDQVKVNEAIQDVKNGIFDYLYYWDHRILENINSQRLMADNLNAGEFIRES